MIIFHLSLPFYLKKTPIFLYWMVPYHTRIYPDKKCEFVFFGNVSTRFTLMTVSLFVIALQ